jgi:hypothetical protein
MSLFTNAVVQQLFVPFILMFFFVGGICCVAVGVGLILFSDNMLKFFSIMNRWITLRRVFRPIAIPRDIWPALQKYRRLVAFAIIGGAVFSLFNLLARIDTHAIATLFALRLRAPQPFVQWLVDSAWWLLVIGSALSIVVGAMLIFSPQPLATLEKASGRWISTRGLTKGGDTMHSSLDQWVAAHPRRAGWIVAVLAAIEVIDIGVLLF